jgi:sigma-B regulation protein RsbU (phosphoserine phosphatase)
MSNLATEPSAKSVQIPESRLSCEEVQGGNLRVSRPVGLPGLIGWVYSNPLEPATAGGDIHYLSVCSHGIFSRFALADVSGHGQTISSLATILRKLIQEHINTWDQSTLMAELSEALEKNSAGDQYATAAVFGYCRLTGELVFTNAGHPAPLWYHASSRRWDWLETAASLLQFVEGLPLGLIPGTSYVQRAVQLAPGDMLLIYTDGITEACDTTGAPLGSEKLMDIVRNLPTESPAAAANGLLAALQAFRSAAQPEDDESFLLLQQTADNAVRDVPFS